MGRVHHKEQALLFIAMVETRSRAWRLQNTSAVTCPSGGTPPVRATQAQAGAHPEPALGVQAKDPSASAEFYRDLQTRPTHLLCLAIKRSTLGATARFPAARLPRAGKKLGIQLGGLIFLNGKWRIFPATLRVSPASPLRGRRLGPDRPASLGWPHAAVAPGTPGPAAEAARPGFHR